MKNGNPLMLNDKVPNQGRGKMTRKQLEGLALAPNMQVVGISARMLRRLKAKVAGRA